MVINLHLLNNITYVYEFTICLVVLQFSAFYHKQLSQGCSGSHVGFFDIELVLKYFEQSIVI